MTDYKDRVSGWPTDIDWSKAPEGFPLWIEDLNPGKGFDCSGWHRDDRDRYTNENGKYWTKLKEGIYRVHSPAPQWNGEGLPPVGITCRIPDDMAGGNGFLAQFEGLTVEIVAHSISSRGHPVAVFSYTGTDGESRFHALADNPNCPNFEPIKTQAQIAAEEREAAIEAMRKIYWQPDAPTAKEALGLLWDAGLRFQKGDDK